MPGQVTAKAPDPLLCVNGDGALVRAACPRCRRHFCDRCLVFSVNDSPWCEPCGNTLSSEVRPRWELGAAILCAGLAGTVLANGLYWRAFGYWSGRVVILGVLVMMLVARFAWHVADPETGSDKPRIVRRR